MPTPGRAEPSGSNGSAPYLIRTIHECGCGHRCTARMPLGTLIDCRHAHLRKAA